MEKASFDFVLLRCKIQMQTLRRRIMSEEYFIAANGESKGPFSLSQLRSMWTHGLLTSDTQYWSACMDDWYIISNLLDEPPQRPASTQPTAATVQTPKQNVTTVPPLENRRYPTVISITETQVQTSSYIIAFVIMMIIIAVGLYLVAPSGSLQKVSVHVSTLPSEAATPSPDDGTISRSSTNSEAIKKCDYGVALVKRGKYEKAIAEFDKAIELDPSVPRFYSQRAYAYYINGQFDRLSNPDSKALDYALADYSKVIELTPKSAEAYYNRGVVYGMKAQLAFTVKQPEEWLRHAQADYTQALIIDPKHENAHYNLEDIRKRLADIGANVEQQTTSDNVQRDANNATKVEFPVGTYRYEESTYITLKPDGTFRVKSDDNLLWSCSGKWSFSGTTLYMKADADKEKRQWLPYIFYLPAGLIANGKDVVVWDCTFTTFEWQKL